MKAKSSAFCCSIGPETEVGGADVQKPLMESFLHLAICWLLDAFVLRVRFLTGLLRDSRLVLQDCAQGTPGDTKCSGNISFFPPDLHPMN